MDSGTSNLLEMLSERVINLANQGKWDEAIRSADAAVEKARMSNTGDANDNAQLAATLEIKGGLYREKNMLEEARLVYLEALELLDESPGNYLLLGKISASIGVLYDQVENEQEAIIYYERAIELYERMDPPMLLDVADICNNLGFVYRSVGQMDTAESLFLKGLSICSSELGAKDEKTATLFNNLGALYLRTGQDEQAREMHTMALEARTESLGKDHIDTAQSYSNLALTLVQLGELEKAGDYFEDSLAIHEKHIKEEPFEYAAVAENYAEYLRATENAKMANQFVKKAQKKLAKVAS